MVIFVQHILDTNLCEVLNSFYALQNMDFVVCNVTHLNMSSIATRKGKEHFKKCLQDSGYKSRNSCIEMWHVEISTFVSYKRVLLIDSTNYRFDKMTADRRGL